MRCNSAEILERKDEPVDEKSESTCDYEVLVVDNDPEVLVVVSLALEVFGYRVTPALNGENAMKLLKNNRFDLMVTDLIMDDMDGITLLKNSKRLYPQTKVILMTGFYDPELILDAIQNQADDYILKPFSLEVLQVKAAQCLSKGKELVPVSKN